MPHCITLSELSCSTPDGRRLFSNLNFSFGWERVGLIGRNGIGNSTLLKVIAGELSPSAGRVSVSSRPHVLHQIVRPAAAETIADLFCAREAMAVVERAQAGTATLDELADVDWLLESSITEALARFGLDAPLVTPLAQLSGGQRTRCGTGCPDSCCAGFPDPRRAYQQSRPGREGRGH